MVQRVIGNPVIVHPRGGNEVVLGAGVEAGVGVENGTENAGKQIDDGHHHHHHRETREPAAEAEAAATTVHHQHMNLTVVLLPHREARATE